MNRPVIGLVGASGFIGSACHSALTSTAEVKPIQAPRFKSHARTAAAAHAEVREESVVAFSEEHLSGVDVLVNAAGQATAPSRDYSALVGANAILPLFLLKASETSGVKRLIHISSAAVQGRGTLDESERLQPTSPYSFSKAWGEALIRRPSAVEVVRYRPTSVQGPTRNVTRQLAKLAASPYATVASPGDDPTPQVPVESVAEAVRLLTDLNREPPAVVLHPWTGTTTESLLYDLGAERVHRMPRPLAQTAVAAAHAVERASGKSGAHARRLEMLLFGQKQEAGWLDARLSKPSEDWVRACAIAPTRHEGVDA